ncbi:receptor-like protein EIX2 [Cucumis melo]|uniref:Receptor-like protein EIX2 n=1 Tax=Cucumis melo TaxID=3656 RepID=A0A1S3CT21_CUCME|nr:receptor-like protein EIX2 [Cucumis melo]
MAFFRFSLCQVSAITCIKKEQEALLQLKKSFNDPSHVLASWNESTNCCNWKGVSCNQITSHVTNIDLQSKQVNSLSNRVLFSNSIDSSLFELKYLVSLDLSWNHFNYSRIPDWFGMLNNLKFLNLENCYLSGRIPSSLGNLSNLEYLDVSDNSLIGEVPTSFGRLLNLKVLDISDNLFNGFLEEAHFANLSQLHTLLIGYNEFLSLDVKSNWVPPFQLKSLDASSCIGCFKSKFPRWLQTQKRLVSLVLSNISISSGIPKWLDGQNLTTLDLSHNQIVGPIPHNIGYQMPNLEDLFLSTNFMNGSLPLSLCKLKNLAYVDLSNNGLFGKIEGCLLTSKLHLLDLSLNEFFGTFPHSHGNDLSNIEQLNLRSNSFEGSMPIVLKNSKILEFIDLEGNKFSGNIPTWVGDNLGNLQFLRLRDNQFNGTIPSNLCNLKNLQILDLAYNQLEGTIPHNLSNFKVMMGNGRNEVSLVCRFRFPQLCYDGKKKVIQSIKLSNFNYSLSQLMLMVNIDLSKNHLVGFIPREITMLKGLIGLNLSHNNLTGKIPVGIGEAKSLESLDLSFNQLSGSIPKSLSELNSLGVLRLSHNNFSGNIPQEGHLSTFNDASSFDNNPYLCGNPLPVKCVDENVFESPKIENQDQEDDKWEKWLLYLMIMFGYGVGFWGGVVVLILKKNWRCAYFKFIDEIKDKILAAMKWR